jgi:membrane-associated phospholipid phosphatase
MLLLLASSAARAQSTPAPAAPPTRSNGDGPRTDPAAERSAPTERARAVVPTPREVAEAHLRLDEPELRWQFRRTDLADWLATAGLSVGILATSLFVPEPEVAGWQGPVLFDGAARDALQLGSSSARSGAATASDALLYALLAIPFVDAGVALVAHGSPDAAAQMATMNMQSYALTYLVTEIIKKTTARERPRASGNGPDEPGDNVSFISGHTSMAFTAAGLTCAHHENLPLYGGGLADRLACYSTLAAATAVGVLRMASDAHYFTDVLVGAGIGFVSGYLLTDLLRYEIGDPDPATGRPSGGTIAPNISPEGAGLTFETDW